MMDRSGLRIDRRTTPVGVWIGVSGELDSHSLHGLSAALGREAVGPPGPVEVDLSELDFIGFVGVHLLVDAGRTLADRGRDLRICASNRHVDRVFELAGVVGLVRTLARTGGTGSALAPATSAGPVRCAG